MKKVKKTDSDTMRDEYHFDYSKAEWGKFAGKVERTKTAVYIDPEVAAAFPDSDTINEALKQVIALKELTKGRKPTSKSKKSNKTSTKSKVAK